MAAMVKGNEYMFFLCGLQLRTDELKAAFTLKAVKGTVYGLVAILGITPLLGFATRQLPLHPQEYVAGLTIFTLAPTTLGVGMSLAQSAKGNMGLAIFLTVASNILGVVLVPLWLKVMLGQGTTGVQGLSINLIDMFVKLLLSVLVPTVLGKLARDLSRPVGAWVKAHRVLLSVVNNTSLALIIWQTLSSARDLIINTTFGNMLLVLLAALTVHVTYLVVNTAAVVAMKTPAPEAVSTIILASQKSAPVAITAISYIASDPVTQGLLAVPAITGQLLQIFLGQPLARYMATRVDLWESRQAELPPVATSQDRVVIVDPPDDAKPPLKPPA
eukprot:gene5196-5434_t